MLVELLNSFRNPLPHVSDVRTGALLLLSQDLVFILHTTTSVFLCQVLCFKHNLGPYSGPYSNNSDLTNFVLLSYLENINKRKEKIFGPSAGTVSLKCI